ncbi:MAG: hypothetical protein QOF40_482 [Actinomycetota bacterium]|nr:hypothetical protein [Actinomycetota bacterium]
MRNNSRRVERRSRIVATLGGSPSAVDERTKASTALAENVRNRVITAAPAASDGGTAGQPVDLSDRRLTVDAVTTPSSGDPGATVVEVKVVITNTGDAAIQNQSAFFQLMGVGGDAFGSRNAGPDPFYDPIDARASRSGSVIFEIPTAAVSNLHLLYRPEVPSDAVVVPLGSR